MQVTIGSIAAALLGFAGSDTKTSHRGAEHLVEIIAMILLPVAVIMVAYALVVFIWRSKAIAKKQVCYYFTPSKSFAVIIRPAFDLHCGRIVVDLVGFGFQAQPGDNGLPASGEFHPKCC